MLRRIRHALYQGHQTWKWRHDTDILLRLLAEAQVERHVRSVEERVTWRGWEQFDPWQA